MISVIIPSYRNPEYLDFCISKLLENQVNINEIVAVIDGFGDMYIDVQKKHNDKVHWVVLDKNYGLPFATNVGVYNAQSDKILIINEDNVVCSEWDKILEDLYSPNRVISVQQTEPSRGIFDFHVKDFGSNLDTMKYQEFIEWEKTVRIIGHVAFSETAFLLPVFMAKKWFMVVNGWDTMYQSPFVCDLDFWYKLQLLGNLQFYTSWHLSFYHFGSRSTKDRHDQSPQQTKEWFDGEGEAINHFFYKWRFYPKRGLNNEVIGTQ